MVELVEVLRGARVLVRLLGALDERVKLDKGVGPARGREILLRLVRRGELAGEVREVGEGELARVRAVADADEAEVALDEVAGARVSSCGAGSRWAGALVRVVAALDAGLGLRVAVEAALHELHFALDLVELGVRLAVVDRRGQEQAWRAVSCRGRATCCAGASHRRAAISTCV